MPEEKVQVFVKKCHEDAVIPSFAHQGDAGFDFVTVEDTPILPLERKLVATGLIFELPEGYELQIRPRSGLSLKTQLIIPNSPGTVDCTYRGEVKVIMWNTSNSLIHMFRKGEKIAQGVITRLPKIELVEVSEVSSTARGEGGFGSTGGV